MNFGPYNRKTRLILPVVNFAQKWNQQTKQGDVEDQVCYVKYSHCRLIVVLLYQHVVCHVTTKYKKNRPCEKILFFWCNSTFCTGIMKELWHSVFFSKTQPVLQSRRVIYQLQNHIFLPFVFRFYLS